MGKKASVSCQLISSGSYQSCLNISRVQFGQGNQISLPMTVLGWNQFNQRNLKMTEVILYDQVSAKYCDSFDEDGRCYTSFDHAEALCKSMNMRLPTALEMANYISSKEKCEVAAATDDPMYDRSVINPNNSLDSFKFDNCPIGKVPQQYLAWWTSSWNFSEDHQRLLLYPSFNWLVTQFGSQLADKKYFNVRCVGDVAPE